MTKDDLEKLRADTARRLQAEIKGMNRDNFLVRPHLEHVEYFAQFRAWDKQMSFEEFESAIKLAGLPTDYQPDDDNSIEARRFDLLALRLQLAVLEADPVFGRLRDTAMETATLLLDQTAIPAVAEERVLITAVATSEWWDDVTPPMLEQMRKKLRGLVRLIDRTRRNPVYTDFDDPAGTLSEAPIVGAVSTVDHDHFKAKIHLYLRSHAGDDSAVVKLFHNEPITAADLDRLEEVFIDAGIATPDDLDYAKQQAGGLGLFLRALTGMDPDSVKAAFKDFCANRQFTRGQYSFLDKLVEYMSNRGVIDIGSLYEPPFTNIAPGGPEDLFESNDVDLMVNIIDGLHKTAEVQ